MSKTIVTFSCQKTIHVYHEKSSVRPMPPYKPHNSIEDAKKFMEEERGIKNPKVIVNK